MARVLVTIILITLFVPVAESQAYPRIPEDTRKFTSLTEALKDPLSVEYLDLRRSGLREFPLEILQMKNLKYLVLSGNRIGSIPDSIGQLTKLEHLNLARNKLYALPSGIGALTDLRVLILRQNPLAALPDGFCELRLLTHLDIWGTELSYLPLCIDNLSASLDVLNMRHLPMSRTEQERIFDSLPETRIFFTAGCRCDE